MTTVRNFVQEACQLVNPSNPTQPLHGNDLAIGIRCINRLISYYAATGLYLTIANTRTVPVITGQEDVVCGPPTYLPTPNITFGRMANVEEAWLELQGVTYPLIDKSRDEYLSSFKYEPLEGLPRFIIVYQETEVTRIRLFPKPSQGYNFNVRGKFTVAALTSDDTMDGFPGYFERFLSFAVAREWAMYKGRSDAWTDKLEALYQEAALVMESTSEVNLSITGDQESLLNGAWRVRAGI